LFNLESSQKMAKIQNSFEIKKRQSQIELMAKDKLIQDETIENQRFQQYMLVGFLGLLFAFAAFLYRNNRKEHQINTLLQGQKIEIEQQRGNIEVQNEELRQQQEELLATNETLQQQKEEITIQNKLIDDQKRTIEGAFDQLQQTSERLTTSIRYAQNIQQAMLPKAETLKTFFSDYFILFLPKDIVSGDFYWFTSVRLIPNSPFLIEENDEAAIFILADCTGHGVPGAFMTMIGNTLIHESVRIKNIYEPDKILQNIDKGIRNILRQDEGLNADGMDISVCFFEKIDTENIIMTMAAAKTSVYYTDSREEIVRLHGNRLSIGGRLSENKQFSSQRVKLKKGDTVYLSSDGFYDQNNSNRQSFGLPAFKKLLAELAVLPLNQQNELLLEALRKHQGSEPQRDDISVVGLKI
jgi:two-component system, sensor histidine kinase LadS